MVMDMGFSSGIGAVLASWRKFLGQLRAPALVPD
jgi:hypothetical protein